MAKLGEYPAWEGNHGDEVNEPEHTKKNATYQCFSRARSDGSAGLPSLMELQGRRTASASGTAGFRHIGDRQGLGM